jgi:DNA polymerase III alpha subunit
LANIDYEQIAMEEGIETNFLSTLEFSKPQHKKIFRAFGGYIVEIRVGKSKRGSYARITLENNYKLCKVLVWSSEYERFEDILKGAEKRLMIFEGDIKYDPKWTKGNQFTIQPNSEVIIL